MESVKPNPGSRESALEESRIKWEKNVANMALAYDVSEDVVKYLYAEKTNQDVEHYRTDLAKHKIFHDPHDEHNYWKAIKVDLQNDILIRRLTQEIAIKYAELAEKDAKLAEEIAHREAAEKAANVDSLTELPNRRAFDLKLIEMINDYHHAINKKIFSIIILDVDNFKEINDKYGHTIGDQVLNAIGKAITNELRGTDFAARYGGEEIVLIVEADGNNAKSAIPRFADAINQITIELSSHEEITLAGITASFGAAEYDPNSGDADGKHAVSRADSAMYESKRGRKKPKNPLSNS